MTTHFRCFFFFQAEDGIRDLVRSRGLGDVYKRQLLGDADPQGSAIAWADDAAEDECPLPVPVVGMASVSYTHLTLPTSDLV